MIEKPTRRQLEIVTLLADGLTHKEIAVKLGSTPNAVEIAIRRARRTTDTENGVQLVAVALREGWIK